MLKKTNKLIILIIIGSFFVSTVTARTLLEENAGENNMSLNKTNEKTALQWEDYLDMLKTVNQIQDYAVSPQSAEAVANYLFMTLAHGYVILSRSDPDHPEFFPFVNHVFPLAAPNPDATYLFSPVAGHNSYRIFGDRGSVYMIDFQIGKDWSGTNGDASTKVLSMNSMDEYTVDKDGHFEILLSTEKPDSYQGNWMQLNKDASYVLVRQFAYHPGEVNARMAIEKLNDYTPKSMASIDLEVNLKKLVNFVQYNSKHFLELFAKTVDAENFNTIAKIDYSKVGGVENQVYQQGLYDVAPDQAIILTFKVPKCKYWNIQLSDLLWLSPEYVHAQSYLNGHIDRSDNDGLTRIVLSHRDTGIANWIDLNNVEKGYLLIRWNHCDKIPNTQLDLVALKDLEKFLPPDTKTVTPEQRQAALRQLSADRQLRRDW